MSSSVQFTLNTASPTEIAEHLHRCDDAFVPPLSTRVEIDGYARKIGRRAERFEAWAGGTLVGLVAAYLNDQDRRLGYVTNVSVEAGFRRTGIASELMTECIESTRQRGFGGIELEVDSANAAAIDLYTNHGFAVCGVPGRTIVMRLQTGRG